MPELPELLNLVVRPHGVKAAPVVRLHGVNAVPAVRLHGVKAAPVVRGETADCKRHMPISNIIIKEWRE